MVFAGTLNGQEVAIKVVERQSCRQQADFLREVHLLKETPAPNIVRFHAATEDGPLMLMVMELKRLHTSLVWSKLPGCVLAGCRAKQHSVR